MIKAIHIKKQPSKVAKANCNVIKLPNKGYSKTLFSLCISNANTRFVVNSLK